jgi:hypothetical protein
MNKAEPAKDRQLLEEERLLKLELAKQECRQATSENLKSARERYLRTLDRFNKLVLEGKLPEDF